MAGKYYYKGVDLNDLIDSGYSGNVFNITASSPNTDQQCANFGYYNNSVAISNSCIAKKVTYVEVYKKLE
jgi:hypothetical protein